MLPKASPESPPMFESRFLDRFTRTHWAAVPVAFMPLCAWLLHRGLVVEEIAWLPALAQFAAGLVVWTLTEYWLHRTLFHWVPAGWLGEKMHFILHGVHHDWPRDRYRLVMPVPVSVGLFCVFLLIFVGLLGPNGWLFQVGFSVGYVSYDMLHYAMHHAPAKWGWFKALRKHHLIHHSPNKGRDTKFGVSTTLWDRVFRTY